MLALVAGAALAVRVIGVSSLGRAALTELLTLLSGFHETSRLGPDYSGMRQRGPRPAGVTRAAAGVPMRRSSAAERVQRAAGPLGPGSAC